MRRFQPILGLLVAGAWYVSTHPPTVTSQILASRDFQVNGQECLSTPQTSSFAIAATPPTPESLGRKSSGAPCVGATSPGDRGIHRSTRDIPWRWRARGRCGSGGACCRKTRGLGWPVRSPSGSSLRQNPWYPWCPPGPCASATCAQSPAHPGAGADRLVSC